VLRALVSIDVGGTFTDSLAELPDGSLRTRKILSTGLVRGRALAAPSATAFADSARAPEPDGFWDGAFVRLYASDGRSLGERRVARFGAEGGHVALDAPLPRDAHTYELDAELPAPILAIRLLLAVPLTLPLPPVDVRLGTTKGTNALLTRRGARTAFVTTRGFGDVLRIGTQARPRLFELTIRKPEPLFERVLEVDERVDAAGRVLAPLDVAGLRAGLSELRAGGVESLAIALLHAHAHPAHERAVAAEARAAGFAYVSVSSEVAPLEKIVWRGDTTVMDAYLAPVLAGYLASLRAHLAEGSRLDVMTSAGGLVAAERWSGKDSVLSGPAGGVVGALRVAELYGAPRVIGFDMGGTSTDVSRGEGGLAELELETEKAGVRVVAPMLAIETVAAGGGSICRFDGVRLLVGPESAGADPGPACYGRGGPLTITDVNVILGRIPPEGLPLPIDVDAARARLAELTSQMGDRETPEALAEGLLAINNESVARAIRAVSSQKGRDPRDHALVSFGGAGAQHACAVARELGVRRVLHHRLSGLLSAYGIHLADVRRFAQESVLARASGDVVARLEATFRGLEARASAEVLAEGVPPELVEAPIRSLDLRYEGHDAALNVPWPAEGTFTAAYEAEHRRIFGYAQEGRPIEIVAARVEVVGRSRRRRVPESPLGDLPVLSQPPRSGRAWFDGRWQEVPIVPRASWPAGAFMNGPAIVCDDGATIVVEPGWRATATPMGDVELVFEGEDARRADEDTSRDPVRLELYNRRFEAVAEHMGELLRRTASSTNVKERLDFSCALFSGEGELVVNAPHIPVHLGAMGETVRSVLREALAIAPGDVFVTNDPYHGGSHLPDVTVVSPVFHEGRVASFVASRAHHAEIGGIVPGSMPPFSTSLADEGVLLRCFRAVEGGRFREDELRALLSSGRHPSRRVDDNVADLRAQIAANQAGEAALRELVRAASWPVLAAYMGHVRDAATEKMVAALRRLGDGSTRTFTDYLDDGTPITVTLTVDGGRARVDFAGTGPVVAGNLNANRAIVTAAVLYAFRCLLDEDIPLNEGVLAPLTIAIPPGCLLAPREGADPASSPAVVGGNVETSQRVVDVVLGALGLAAASQGTMNNLTLGDGTFGYYETICGGAGATARGPGADAVHTHMTNTRLTDPEVLERRYPVRVVGFAIRRGSGGAGAHRGGDGAVRELEVTRPLEVSILSERRGPYAPYGLLGGSPGALGKNLLLRAGSPIAEILPAKGTWRLEPGDRLTIETPGGGGFGAP
jgi:5-oxoprolinase (ATP-hydrolysing)